MEPRLGRQLTVSPRLTMAVTALAPRPGERILEVGCGQGVLVGALADVVGDGHVVGLDRSEKMLAIARRTQAHHLESGLVSFVKGHAQDLDPEVGPFDAVIAARVREMTTDASVLPVVRDAMAAGSRLLLVLDSPTGCVPDSLLASAIAAVTAGGFTDVTADHLDASVSCVRARR